MNVPNFNHKKVNSELICESQNGKGKFVKIRKGNFMFKRQKRLIDTIKAKKTKM
jgi:hypothetical protein